MRVTILGSGTSTGVPVIGCSCSVCRSPHLENRRTRASIMVTIGNRNLLFDTSPELRLQILSNGFTQVDAVLYSHMHADHTAGFDDLRAFYFQSRKPLKIYMLPEYIEEIKSRFAYAFLDTGYAGIKPQVVPLPLYDKPLMIEGIEVDPVRVDHGHVSSCGFRIANFAYVTDFKNFPQSKISEWRGKVDVMIASGIHFGTHASHSVIPETIQLFEDLGVTKGVLSHLAHEVDYFEHQSLLPDFVEFAYDGMKIDVLEPVS
jgi:phosphoribosyl 1,2-cyclic phosphate phosphodiesterase